MGDVTLVIKRILNATPEVVFDAWIDSKQVEAWYGPEGFTNTIHSFEAKEGGAYRLTMHGPDGDHVLRGAFKTINRPRKLVFTWQWEGEGQNADEGGETLVTVEFKKVDEKTEMTITHEGFADEKAREMHSMGWSSSFNKLEKLFA